MNIVILIGNITKDIELKKTINGTEAVNFSLAISRQYKNENGEYDTDFINCVAWRKTAELLSKYCSKGSKIAVEGRIQTRSYLDSNENRKYITEVLAENITFLSSNKKNENTSNENSVYQIDTDNIELNDEDLPF